MNYFMGIDLARKTDWTVATVIDSSGNVVAMDRFHQVSWALQVDRCAMLYRTFHCTKAVVDSTGLGDVVIEQLEAEGLTIEAYIFTVPSRRALIEELVLAFDNCEITIPATEKFRVFRSEIEAFEYSLDGSTIRYEAPPGIHDDCVMSLALAVHGWRGSRSSVLGVIENLKRLAAAGKDALVRLFATKPGDTPGEIVAIAKAVAQPVEYAKPANCERCGQDRFDANPVGTPPKFKCVMCGHWTLAIAGSPKVISGKKKFCCPQCSSEALTIGSGAPPNGRHCNQCGCNFDLQGNVLSAPPPSESCSYTASGFHEWKKLTDDEVICAGCNAQRWLPGRRPTTNGMSRTEYKRHRDGLGLVDLSRRFR